MADLYTDNIGTLGMKFTSKEEQLKLVGGNEYMVVNNYINRKH